MTSDKSVIVEKEKQLMWEAPKIMKISQEQAWAVCDSTGNSPTPNPEMICNTGEGA